jgi:hypothetical protein
MPNKTRQKHSYFIADQNCRLRQVTAEVVRKIITHQIGSFGLSWPGNCLIVSAFCCLNDHQTPETM